MSKRPVESGWGGDAVVCADSVGGDRGGSGEPAWHDSVHRPGLIFPVCSVEIESLHPSPL
jgi:hypothetical protein